MKLENVSALPFLNVLVEREQGSFITSGYHRHTFIVLYTKWNSFVPKQRKINLSSTFFHLALMICSPFNLEKELANIYNIFLDNCYPQNVVETF